MIYDEIGFETSSALKIAVKKTAKETVESDVLNDILNIGDYKKSIWNLTIADWIFLIKSYIIINYFVLKVKILSF